MDSHIPPARVSVRLSVHQTDLGGDNPPAVGKAHPRLLLTPKARAAFAGKLGAAYRHVRAKGGDGGMAQVAGQTGGGAGGAKGADRLNAIQIFAAPSRTVRGSCQNNASSASMLLLTSASSY